MDKIKICIDAGHATLGGDCGAVGNGFKEADLTLKVAKSLDKMLVTDGRFETRMTRLNDYGVNGYPASTSPELSARANISDNFMGANGLFVSIHFNSFADPSANGVEVLTYNNTGLSKKFADGFCHIMSNEYGLRNRGAKAVGGTIAVIREPKATSVLTECGFISNASDMHHFNTDAKLEKLAWMHYRAICGAFGIETRNVYGVVTKTPLQIALDKLVASGVISSRDYWEANAQDGKTCDGAYVSRLIQNMATKL